MGSGARARSIDAVSDGDEGGRGRHAWGNPSRARQPPPPHHSKAPSKRRQPAPGLPHRVDTPATHATTRTCARACRHCTAAKPTVIIREGANAAPRANATQDRGRTHSQRHTQARAAAQTTHTHAHVRTPPAHPRRHATCRIPRQARDHRDWLARIPPPPTPFIPSRWLLALLDDRSSTTDPTISARSCPPPARAVAASGGRRAFRTRGGARVLHCRARRRAPRPANGSTPRMCA